jgi:hypothetical protein
LSGFIAALEWSWPLAFMSDVVQNKFGYRENFAFFSMRVHVLSP